MHELTPELTKPKAFSSHNRLVERPVSKDKLCQVCIPNSSFSSVRNLSGYMGTSQHQDILLEVQTCWHQQQSHVCRLSVAAGCLAEAKKMETLRIIGFRV